MTTTVGIVQRISMGEGTACVEIGTSPSSTELLTIPFHPGDSVALCALKRAMLGLLVWAQAARIVVRAAHGASDAIVTEVKVVSFVNVLVVVDGIFTLDTVYPSAGQPDPDHYFSISTLLATLRASTTPYFRVDTANRGFNWFYNGNRNTEPDPHATVVSPNPFVFDDANVDLSNYDELWLIGYEGSNFGVRAPQLQFISDDEVAAIARFMEGGGGVFATGDHDGLGSLMCGRIPRVRSMRRWFSGLDADPRIPSQAPRSWPGVGASRADTLFVGDMTPAILFFDDQSDDIPQPLSVLEPDHPIIQGRTGPLTGFPDHMHEGEVMLPWTLDETLTFQTASGVQAFVEYPSLSSGPRETPRIIATGKVQGGHQTLTNEPGSGACENSNFSNATDPTEAKVIGILAAYDGYREGVGRVVTDSSFHHYLDLNLIGDPCSPPGSPKQQGFNSSPQGRAVLADLQACYVNIAAWLARSVPETLP